MIDNSLNRQFDVAEQDRTWVTDITYIRTHDGFAHLAVIIDLFSRRIVGSLAAEAKAICADAFRSRLAIDQWQTRPLDEPIRKLS